MPSPQHFSLATRPLSTARVPAPGSARRGVGRDALALRLNAFRPVGESEEISGGYGEWSPASWILLEFAALTNGRVSDATAASDLRELHAPGGDN